MDKLPGSIQKAAAEIRERRENLVMLI